LLWCAPERSCKGHSWYCKICREHSSSCGFWFSLRLLLPHLFFRMTTATIVGGMCCFSFSQLAVAACRCWRSVLPLRTVCMQVADHTPQAAARILAICPDVAKLLAAVALCKGIL
jgi:hypothetical protein